MQKSKMTHPNDQYTGFNGLEEKAISELFRLATIKKFQAGDILIKEGDTDQIIFVILNGKVRMLERF